MTKTNFEKLVCQDCGHEHARACGRTMRLPCSKCGASSWLVYDLVPVLRKPEMAVRPKMDPVPV